MIRNKDSIKRRRSFHSLTGRALKKVHARFEDATILDRDEVLSQHNTEHTKDVIARACSIAFAMGLLGDEIELAMVGAAFHDVVRTWSAYTDFTGLVVRRGNPYLNEVASAHEAMLEMVACDFGTKDQQLLVMAGIIATSVVPSEISGGMFQPLLNKSSHPVVRALALADLNSAAMASTPELVSKEARVGDKMFRERELSIGRKFHDLVSRPTLTTQEEYEYRARMLHSTDAQVDFLFDRSQRLTGELGSHKDDLATVLCLGSIERVIGAVNTLNDKRKEMDIWELAGDMGYGIPAK